MRTQLYIVFHRSSHTLSVPLSISKAHDKKKDLKKAPLTTVGRKESHTTDFFIYFFTPMLCVEKTTEKRETRGRWWGWDVNNSTSEFKRTNLSLSRFSVFTFFFSYFAQKKSKRLYNLSPISQIKKHHPSQFFSKNYITHPNMKNVKMVKTESILIPNSKMHHKVYMSTPKKNYKGQIVVAGSGSP